MKIKLYEIMVERDLTIRQVSILTGIPRSAIENILLGISSPRMDTMERLAKGLKVSISDLYESDYK